MCGIVGMIGGRPVAPLLLDALRRLEYRGYDSAGIALLNDGRLDRRRASGKLDQLASLLAREPLEGTIGIGHTRWATHGAPTEMNAHPHVSGRIAVVHNGIIENFRALRQELEQNGYQFESDTDTECVAHLIAHAMDEGATPQEALSQILPRLAGAFALAVLVSGEEDLLLAARRGSPLAIGHGDGEMYIGSDAIALAPLTNQITYLEDGDWAVVRSRNVVIYNEGNHAVKRPIQISLAHAHHVDKGNYRHFMAKEIHEQGDAIAHTLAHYIDMTRGRIQLQQSLPFNWKTIPRLTLSACGTASYAAMIGKYWFERFARLPVECDIASEFRYREVPLVEGGLSLFISQSGETADTLASLRYCQAQKQHIGSIVNVRESTIARESNCIFPTLAGPEIGVASTKAFTCQLSVLACLAIAAGRAVGHLSDKDEERLVESLIEIPRFIGTALHLEREIEELARELVKVQNILYLGRGTSYPLAMEGALKLKEISYIHAEGYAAGELKHGPIALVDETMPVVVVAPYDYHYDKTISNMQEVAARGGRIILITDQKGADEAGVETMATLIMPDVPATIVPIIYSIPIQLLAYHTAVFIGTDVDQPRNLAKSVTVE